jgi:hypothetical protein
LSDRSKFLLLFLFLFLFRTLFGLSQSFFSPDELQTYLIGLKSYTTGAWPWFGPDLIVTETGYYSQMPGALEGLLVGLPFRIWPAPEAPFLLLNLLSLGALAFLARYLSRRIPEIPFFFTFAWLSLLPWNLHESTNPLNPSYLLAGSVCFFIGFLEAVPSLSAQWLAPTRAFALMGFGLFWDMQFHSSWMLLPPFILAALAARRTAGKAGVAAEALGFLAGSVFPLAFLLPTLIRFGFARLLPALGTSLGFNPSNFLDLYLIVPRFLALPTFEIPRFLFLPGIAHHFDFFRLHPWLAVPGIFLTLTGWAQPFFLLALGWKKDPRHPESRALALANLGALLWVWVSFWFTTKPPSAHIYYLLLPLAAVFSFYVWSRLAARRGWRLFALACIMASLWFQGGYLVQAMKVQSLYTGRDKVVRAIREKDSRLLGERRPGSFN